MLNLYRGFSLYLALSSRLGAIAAALLISTINPTQAATAYPTKSIRFVVGFPPGGGNDTMARMVSVRLADRLGQPVVIDNRPGAGANLAAEIVSKTAPDGYTILMISSSHPIQGLLKKHLQYDPIRDFTGIAQLANYRSVLVIHPAAGATTVRELVALAKAKPGHINFASPGTGTGTHLAGEMFRYMTGINIVHVPYKGTAQATTDLMSGRVQIMFSTLVPVIQHIQAGRLRALAVTSATRSRIMPELPTIAEAGVNSYEFGAWYGIVGPARVPPETVGRLHAETLRTLQSQEIKDRLLAEDMDGSSATPAQFDEARNTERVKWTRIVKQLGLQFD